ncbi:hypothetical protein SAMN04490243_0561 [Robiginitalea myxolifaciens]|uniref:DUF3575 domain-containing protein n=1 Tax=Robiginitalea myxolifaciens TaxID=400055 RepID=A0A1I6FSB2_9FLAO|nr:DUF3575 domain-containing protein [Robiginitalea myxolifaciens]SFR32835.1 hypothetical protein SAMN04490243_0561 [Robiginitalea myxolifaciens]
MKRNSLLLAFALLFCCVGFAQEEETTSDQPRDEIKVNMLFALAEVPELTYERLLSEDTGLGVSVGFTWNDDIEYKLGIVPFYRFYFGDGYARGFFLEANTFFGSVAQYDYDFTTDMEITENEFTFGLGIAAGAKFLTSKNWIGEIYLGVGRYFNGSLGVEAYPRIGIVFGKRF